MDLGARYVGGVLDYRPAIKSSAAGAGSSVGSSGDARAAPSAFFAPVRRVGHSVFTLASQRHGNFALPRPEFAEFRESRDHEYQRKSAADDPDSNLIESGSEMRMAWQKRSISLSI
jgi:hypothetical protein